MGREFEIRKEVALEATPEQVWHAIATPKGQAAWMFPAEKPEGVVDYGDPGEDSEQARQSWQAWLSAVLAS